MFERPHHQRIAAVLAKLDVDLFTTTQCLFAGGTAIALQLQEYRRSDDIDFLCASTAGYRRLREIVFEHGFFGLCRNAPVLLREVRSDQYGIRAILGDSQAPIKFEIVREARIELETARSTLAGVPVLSRTDLFAEKLLANTDRGLDRSTLHRDLIDLCLMISHWGPIPSPALMKARRAYGTSIDHALARTAGRLLEADVLIESLARMDAVADSEARVRDVLQRYFDRDSGWLLTV